MGAAGMTNVVVRVFRAATVAGVLAMALAAGGCANRPNDAAQAAAGATPGSQQDFVVNVGDRVFFESDSSELTPQSIADAGKAGAVAAGLQPIHLHDRGPRRRARHARVQHRARRPARPDGARISLLARGQGQRMRTISYGKERPVAVCNDISCWSQNRRAVTVLNTSS